jgi:hypothetical protein
MQPFKCFEILVGSQGEGAGNRRDRQEFGLRPSADCDWVWDWDWVTLGSPKDHATVSQSSRKGLPWVE